MPDQDYEDILGQNVENAKKSIEDLEDPDYEKLLELEKENKGRKTVKSFLEKKVDSEQETEETEDDSESYEEISVSEEADKDPLLSGFSQTQLLTGGALIGLLVGLVAGFGFNMADAGMAHPDEIESSVNQLFEASGQDVQIEEIVERNGMYYVTVGMQIETEEGSEQQMESFYISPDGELLFPEMQNQMMQNPIPIQDTISQIEAMQEQAPQEAPEAELEDEVELEEIE